MALLFQGRWVTGTGYQDPPCEGRMRQKEADANQLKAISKSITI